jgi:hypothetical protein
MSAPSSDKQWKKRINGPFSIAATLCVVLFVLVGCGPSEENVERTTDQIKLEKIAAEDKDVMVRIAALRKVTDQAFLEKIAVEDKDVNVRRAAVYELTDQALLEKIIAEEKEMNKRIRTESSGARNGVPAARNP